MTTRRRGKSKANLELIQLGHDIAERNHPITVRGLCYKLFVRGLIPDMSKKSTQRVSQQLTDAREKNICGWRDDWRWIVDETREAERIASWKDPGSLMHAAVSQYRRDNWRAQPKVVELWSEKGTVRGVCKPVLDEFGITFRVMHGYASYSAIREVAEEINRSGKPFIAIYVGDHDPSGRHMSDADAPARLRRYLSYAAEDRLDLNALFFDDDDVADDDDEPENDAFVIERVAIAKQDCTEALPSFPASDKRKDTRYPWFVERHGHRCWELDAMDEVELRQRVRDAIQAHMDMDRWALDLAIEKRETDSMAEYFDAIKATARHYRRHRQS